MSLDQSPPLVQALLNEKLDLEVKPEQLKRRFVELRKAFRDQADWTISHYDYAHSGRTAEGSFSIVTLAGLDLFSHKGACQTRDCRLGYVDRFARTFGVYADEVLLSDPFTPLFLTERSPSALWMEKFADDLRVLRRIRPLIEAGVVRFRAPMRYLCEFHMREFLEKAGALADEIVAASEVTPAIVRATQKAVAIETSDLFNQPMVWEHKISKEERELLNSGGTLEDLSRKVMRNLVLREATDAVTVASVASELGAIVFSNSRFGLSALVHADRRAPNAQSFADWEARRETMLPWIGNLTIDQVIQLRSEAGKALPRFRQKLANAFRPVDGGSMISADQAQKQLADTVAELKEEAAEVEAELSAIDFPRERSFRGLAGILGLSIAGYGFASDALGAVAASSSLLTLLGLIHQVGAKEQRDVAKAKSRPGYVLVKAKDILKHADSD